MTKVEEYVMDKGIAFCLYHLTVNFLCNCVSYKTKSIISGLHKTVTFVIETCARTGPTLR